jgi:hypothetical protein
MQVVTEVAPPSIIILKVIIQKGTCLNLGDDGAPYAKKRIVQSAPVQISHTLDTQTTGMLCLVSRQC